MSYPKITELLPHRDPFLFIDKINSVTETHIIGEKLFTGDEPFFSGHFPGYPVVPGVIMLEALAQCGGAGINAQGILGDALFFLAAVDKVKFRQQIKPGDLVRFEIENVRVSPKALKQKGKAYVRDEPAVEAEWLCLVNVKKADPQTDTSQGGTV